MTAVPKLGARHSWDGGSVVLGDPTVTSPRFRIRQIDGLGSLGERDDHRDPNYARLGETPRRSPRRGKTVTYRGWIEAATLDDLRVGEAMLEAAFAATDERRMDILTPLSPDKPSMYFLAGAQACDITEIHDPFQGGTEWRRDYVLALRLSDPRVYHATQTAVTTGPSAATEGLMLPQTPAFTLPVGVIVVGAAQATNPGTAPAPPLIDVPGPLNGPWVRNDTLGRTVSMPSLVVPAGSWVRVDFAQRAVLIEAQSDVTGTVDFVNSDWWYPDIPGLQGGHYKGGIWADGVNIVRASDTQGRLPKATVRFNAADWG